MFEVRWHVADQFAMPLQEFGVTVGRNVSMDFRRQVMRLLSFAPRFFVNALIATNLANTSASRCNR
jgi:hypothetical protein